MLSIDNDIIFGSDSDGTWDALGIHTRAPSPTLNPYSRAVPSLDPSSTCTRGEVTRADPDPDHPDADNRYDQTHCPNRPHLPRPTLPRLVWYPFPFPLPFPSAFAPRLGSGSGSEMS